MRRATMLALVTALATASGNLAIAAGAGGASGGAGAGTSGSGSTAGVAGSAKTGSQNTGTLGKAGVAAVRPAQAAARVHLRVAVPRARAAT
jgi:hypothetical protein